MHKLPIDNLCACEQCGKVCRNSATLWKHRYVVHAPATIDAKCPHCPKRFPTEAKFRKHVQRHDTPNNQCGICKKMFRLKSNLKLHMDVVHIRNISSLCHICGASFVYPEMCKAHIEKCKAGMSAIIKRPRRSDPHVGQLHKCHFCTRSFAKIAHIRQHYEVEHNTDERFGLLCLHCNELMATETEKTLHISTTKGERLKCDLCTTRMVIRCDGMFRKHQKMHADNSNSCPVGALENNVLCSLIKNRFLLLLLLQECGIVFLHKNNLYRHLDSAHRKILRFKCDDCDRQFTTNFMYKNHLLTNKHLLMKKQATVNLDIDVDFAME